MGLFDNPFKEIKKGLDAVGGFFEDIVSGDIGSAFEDTLKGGLGFVTLGYTNKYDDKFLPDVENPSSAIAFEDRKQTGRNPVAEREIVYGRVKKGGTIVYMASSGENDEFFHLIVVLAAHSCEDVETVYFGETQATLGGFTASGVKTFNISSSFKIEGEAQAEIKAVLNAGSTMPSAIYNASEPPPGLTSAHAMRGCCYLYVRLKYSRDVFRQGIPKISVLMRGKNDIYDPRNQGQSYTNNAALVALDYLRNAYGLGVPNSDIDLQSFRDGADYAEETLFQFDTFGAENRFSADGICKINTQPFKNMEAILRTSGAYLAYSVGQWSYVRAEFTPPSVSFDDNDIISALSVVPGTARAGRLNKVKGVYVSKDTWERADYPPVVVPGYVADDQETLESSLDLAFVTSPYQAQRLAKLSIERSRYGLTISGLFKFKALQLSAGDRINLTVSGLGITDRAFLVVEMGLDMGSGVNMVLREDVAEVYTWTGADNKEITAPPPLNLPSPNPVDPINFTIGEELYQTTQSNVIKVRVLLSWQDPPARSQTYDLQYREDGGEWLWVGSSIFGVNASIDDVKPGNFDFRIRALNELGWVGSWSQYSGEILGKLAPPPDVDTLFLDEDVLLWTYLTPPVDLAGFIVKTHQGDRQTWADATKVHAGIVTASRFSVRGLIADTTTFLVKAVDTSGVESENAAVVVVSNAASQVQNVIFTYDYKANAWPGVITNGQISGSNEIEADQVGGFYNPDSNSIFYNADPATDFYNNEYLKLEYEFEYDVLAQDAGSQLSIDYSAIGESSQIEYIVPGGGSTYTPFSGVIPGALEGTYKFKIIIPSQFGGTPSKITDVFLNLDVPDIEERFENIAISSAGTRLPIQKTYRGIAYVSLTMQTDGSGVASLKVDDKDEVNGPLVYAYNSSGVAVNTTIDALIRGF